MATSSGKVRKSCFITRIAWAVAVLMLSSTYVMAQISWNGTDLFCDSKSVTTGGVNIATVATVQCAICSPATTNPYLKTKANLLSDSRLGPHPVDRSNA